MKNDKEITAIIKEASKILKNNPEFKHYQAKAKEVLKSEKNNVQKQC